MSSRKRAFNKSLANLGAKQRAVAPDTLARIGPTLLDDAGRVRTNQILCGDSIALLNAGPEGWADLVFADPPFNIGYLYHGYDDRRDTKDYLDFSRDWMRAVHRALKPGGSFFLAIGDEYAADLCVIARRELGLTMRNWIIWHYTFGQQPHIKFARSHTHILYFTNGEKNFTFNGDAVRVPSARQTTYADRRANPKGKLPDDVWYLRPQETPEPFFSEDSDTWHVSRVCGTFKEREGWHGCQMPMAVLNRIISVASNPGDVVLDPFNGSGTTTASAMLLGRQYVGIEQSQEYVNWSLSRMEHARQQLADSATGASATPAPAKTDRLHDPSRPSRLIPATDALGRARVARRQARSA